jgi:hypothetical protein
MSSAKSNMTLVRTRREPACLSKERAAARRTTQRWGASAVIVPR